MTPPAATAARLLNFPANPAAQDGRAESLPSPDSPELEVGGSPAGRYHVVRFPSRPRRKMGSPPASSSDDPGSGSGPLAPEATVELLARVKAGDNAALDQLMGRCIRPLCRWAHGRLPSFARDVNDTADLVQEAVISALRRLNAFEVRHQGGLQAYLRMAVKNRIRDLIRRHRNHPQQADLPEDLEDGEASPLEQAIGAQNVHLYEEALERLRPDDREAIIGRLELQYSYEELAVVLNKSTAASARMAVTRAMRRLADEFRHGATPAR